MSFNVNVGRTDFPLRPTAQDPSPVPAFSANAHGDAFRLLDGPPYANGAPHLGHVLNKHLKDAVARAVQAGGVAVEWRPGWDCHGLPLELAVEKQGVRRDDRLQFTAAARAFASSQAALQSQVFQSQGWAAQWDLPWHTQDPHMEAGTLRVLARLLDRGLVDVRFTAVPWCPQCASTLSNAEQEEKEVSLPAWLVPFELDGGQQMLSWTTTPWTLPLHRALVVNPDAEYVLLVMDAGSAWVSCQSSEKWAARLNAQVSRQVCKGSDLAGQVYRSPWTQGVVQSDAAVVAEAGTGVLHAVPGLSELDTDLGRRHGWGLVQHLGVHGEVVGSPCVEQEGKRAGTAANAPVHGAYANSPWFRELLHTAPQAHCWRHHTPLLTRASRQVFLSLTDDVRARAASMVDKLAFSPESGRARLQAAMRDRPAWCLSRQRTWGVPVALFLDRTTGQPHPKASVFMGRVADALEADGVEAWWSRPSHAWLGEDATLDEVERVDDVLDVWFDSGCVPQLVGPADVVVEGTDQHRGWFQSCLWLAAALGEELPFKRVATHGFVVDRSGEKLSKSKGGDRPTGAETTVAAWHQLPTDVVRVWAMAGTDGNDKAWTTDTVQLAQGWLSRWRGVVRFLLSNVLEGHADAALAPASPAWDRYWWMRAKEVSDAVVGLVASAHFGEAVAMAAEFGEAFSSCALGSWKDRLYCAPFQTTERQALDVVVQGCLHEWGRMMEVLAPRMRRDAQAFWPSLRYMRPAPVTELERAQVEQVLAVRAAMGPVMERMAKEKKGGAGGRRVAWPTGPAWPGQLLADALDVGQVVAHDQGLNPLSLCVDGQSVTLGVGWSADPMCPRCRRAQPKWCGDVCGTCAHRLSAVSHP